MMALDSRREHEGLARQECLRLLAARPVGRVAIVVDETPMIFPVSHHVLDAETIAFCSDDVSEVADATGGVPMSLEVDGIDDAGQLWSVAVSGVGREVADESEVARLRQLGLQPAGAGSKQRWIEIRPETISGRRSEWHGWSKR